MTLFWIITAAMIAAALALLAPPLLRRPPSDDDNRSERNVEIAREHLAELTRQRGAGELSDEEFEQARRDVEFALAEDLSGTTQSPAAPSSGGRWALLVAGLLIPLITVPLYLKIGSPQLIAGLPATPQVAAAGQAGGEMPPLDELVKQLRARMDANPDNAEGWFLLGRTYMRLDDYANAVYAFDKVVGLLPNEPAALLALADALTMQNARRVPPRALTLLQQALDNDPTSIAALWLLGNAALDRGDKAQAVDYWQRAYPLLTDEPSMQADLGQMIREAGGTPPVASANAQTAAAAPDNIPADAQPPSPSAAGGAAITVEVALAPFLIEQTSDTDTLFVLARAESGPPMPLAVSRHQVGELPLRVTLTDAMAMMPAMRLSAFPRVKISAKISKSGQAATQAGDLLADDVVVDSANAGDGVQLLIDRVAE